MKKIKYIIGFLVLSLFSFVSCEEENYDFGEFITPSNLVITYDIVGADGNNPYGDGSGTVNFSVSADNAITYKFIYNGSETMAPDGNHTYNFGITGTHVYTVTAIATGTGGLMSSSTVQVEVLALYSPPADLLEMLHGGTSKTWRVKAESGGHFGVGPADADEPIWWAANAFDKAGLGAYDDRITFNSDGTFVYDTGDDGAIYGKADPLANDFTGPPGYDPNGDNEYENYPATDFTSSWSLSAPGGQETLTFGGTGYHGFYVGGDHSYRILARNATEMSVMTVGADGLGWFGILTSDPEQNNEPTFDTLVWSDEFETNGSPDNANWTYDLGAGGWGNGEVQTYTDAADNVIVEDGMLKIIAKDDGNGGYTSARVKSQGLQSFKYGRVDVRAKLPNAQGTWPAIWMLGDSFDTVGWPHCGEIDIMEQTGQDKANTLGTLHWFDEGSASNASFGETTAVANTSSEFHVYSLEWTETSLKIFVDDVKFFEMANDQALPFNDNFFFILNIAMGGSLGGTIDPAFTEDIMEIDYVRVYQ